jgi:ribosome maturation factor RimP
MGFKGPVVAVETIRKSEVELKVLDLCERYLRPHGFHTVDVDCILGGRSTVRIFVEPQKAPDKEEVAAHTSIDDCARASGLIGTVLDVEEVMTGSYDLEVSSPGLDRRLRTQQDFSGHLNKLIQLRLVDKIEGLGATPKGKLLEAANGNITIENEKKIYSIPLSNIRRANLVWEATSGKNEKRRR